MTTSCKEEEDPRHVLIEDSFPALLGKSMRSDEFAIFIIPNAGCEGCITNSESFIVEKLTHFENLHVVLTRFSSMKSLRLKLGTDIVDHSRVYLDTEDLFNRGELVSFYPIIVYMNNGKVGKIDEVSPMSPLSLDSLADYLIRTKAQVF